MFSLQNNSSLLKKKKKIFLGKSDGKVVDTPASIKFVLNSILSDHYLEADCILCKHVSAIYRHINKLRLTKVNDLPTLFSLKKSL